MIYSMSQRSELERLKKRLEEPCKFIQILTGPRQVGKTTLLSQLIGKLELITVGVNLS